MVTNLSFGGGLLDNNVYANNKKKKEEMDFMQGLLTDPAYQRAKANNQNIMSAINNPTPDNVMQRVNALTPEMDIEYPAEVLAEPKKRNMLEEYLFGSLGFQPSVEQKKSVYRATKNLTDMEKLFFKNNPDKFFEYFHKTGSFAPKSEINSNNATAMEKDVLFADKMRTLRDSFPKDSPDYARYDKIVRDIEARMQSYKYDPSNKAEMSYAGEYGKQGKPTYQKVLYDDDMNIVGYSNDFEAFHTPSTRAIDTNFSNKIYTPFVLEGKGFNDAQNIAMFNEVIQYLDDPELVTSGVYSELVPEKITRIQEGLQNSGYEPEKDNNGKRYEINNTQDLIRAVVFQSLKKTLGGQFTEREAERLVEATFNPSLPPEVNLRRLLRMKETMVQRFRETKKAIDHWEHNNGSLFGYESTIGSVDLAKINNQSLRTYRDEVIEEMFDEDDYYNLSDSDIKLVYDNAGILERKFIERMGSGANWQIKK
tara:strand:+ start:745 stop:2184 length:1440 start_codon:yes stop_codon:yes gene_type:complete